jgi:hypothetical protein
LNKIFKIVVLENMGYMEEHGLTGFEYPPETKCDIFQPQVEQLLRALGWEPEDYWVSDESIIADFVSFGIVQEGDLAPIEQLGIEVGGGDFVWEVAARLKKHQE